jgi:hypothetical protein
MVIASVTLSGRSPPASNQPQEAHSAGGCNFLQSSVSPLPPCTQQSTACPAQPQEHPMWWWMTHLKAINQDPIHRQAGRLSHNGPVWACVHDIDNLQPVYRAQCRPALHAHAAVGNTSWQTLVYGVVLHVAIHECNARGRKLPGLGTVQLRNAHPGCSAAPHDRLCIFINKHAHRGCRLSNIMRAHNGPGTAVPENRPIKSAPADAAKRASSAQVTPHIYVEVLLG